MHYFSGNQQSFISFIKIKNLIKNALSLNCQYVAQNIRTYFAKGSFFTYQAVQTVIHTLQERY